MRDTSRFLIFTHGLAVSRLYSGLNIYTTTPLLRRPAAHAPTSCVLAPHPHPRCPHAADAASLVYIVVPAVVVLGIKPWSPNELPGAATKRNYLAHQSAPHAEELEAVSRTCPLFRCFQNFAASAPRLNVSREPSRPLRLLHALEPTPDTHWKRAFVLPPLSPPPSSSFGLLTFTPTRRRCTSIYRHTSSATLRNGKSPPVRQRACFASEYLLYNSSFASGGRAVLSRESMMVMLSPASFTPGHSQGEQLSSIRLARSSCVSACHVKDQLPCL